MITCLHVRKEDALDALTNPKTAEILLDLCYPDYAKEKTVESLRQGIQELDHETLMFCDDEDHIEDGADDLMDTFIENHLNYAVEEQ